MRIPAAQLAALLFAGALGAPLAAQDRVHPLFGVVQDTGFRRLPGIEVLLLSPKRSTTTDAQGRFRFDSVPGGIRHLLVRRIGFMPVHPAVELPLGDTLRVTLLPTPQILPTLIVASERPGIRGVVGDTGYHAIPGALVELLGALRADTTDEHGRFGFENVKQGQYMLRVAREGYVSRLVPIELGKQGLEYSIFLNEFRLGMRDWAGTREGLIAMGELGSRLAMEPRRNRMTRADLERYGTTSLCDIPRLGSLQRDRQGRTRNLNVLIRGTSWIRNAGLCGWSADELDMIEFGEDPCSDASRTIAYWLGVDCGANPRRIRSFGYATVPTLRGAWISLWPRS